MEAEPRHCEAGNGLGSPAEHDQLDISTCTLVLLHPGSEDKVPSFSQLVNLGLQSQECAFPEGKLLGMRLDRPVWVYKRVREDSQNPQVRCILCIDHPCHQGAFGLRFTGSFGTGNIGTSDDTKRGKWARERLNTLEHQRECSRHQLELLLIGKITHGRFMVQSGHVFGFAVLSKADYFKLSRRGSAHPPAANVPELGGQMHTRFDQVEHLVQQVLQATQAQVVQSVPTDQCAQPRAPAADPSADANSALPTVLNPTVNLLCYLHSTNGEPGLRYKKSELSWDMSSAELADGVGGQQLERTCPSKMAEIIALLVKLSRVQPRYQLSADTMLFADFFNGTVPRKAKWQASIEQARVLVQDQSSGSCRWLYHRRVCRSVCGARAWDHQQAVHDGTSAGTNGASSCDHNCGPGRPTNGKASR